MMNSFPSRAVCLLSALPILSALFFQTSVFAASEQCLRSEVVDRPRIGLVLGGGGARGYAHVGVLKKLEELRIPFDLIAGTSMGSIVGGLLATGMESGELAQVIRNADWDDLFTDKTQREDLPFRRKTEDTLGLFGPKLGVGKDNDLLPKGVVSGQKIVFMFESVVSQRINTSNFNNLPIPFRAIATDIVSGEMVVIGDGELSMAMRASMAVPGVFDPVKRGDALLVDGGLVRNLPVDVAKDLGADVVIAVDVGTKLAGKEQMTNALAIIYQMSGILTVHNTNIQIDAMGGDDILISPAIGNLISSADFSKLEEAIPLGYAAAEAVQDQLEGFSLSQSDYDAWRRQVESCVEGLPRVHFVQLNNQSRFSDDVIMEMINIKPGDDLDLEQLDHDLRQIYGQGFIRQARYSVIEQDGQQGIEITVLPDERGADFIETGLDLRFSGRGTDFNLRGAYLKTDLDDRGAEFRAILQVGESPGIFVDYFKPLDDRLAWSLNPSVSYFRRPLYIYDQAGDARAQVELDELGGDVAITREFGGYARASAGLTRYTGEFDVVVGDPAIEPFFFDGAELFLDLEYDRLDDRYLPTRGMFSSLKYVGSLESLGADQDFEQLEFSIFSNHTIRRHNFMLGARYNTSFDEDIPIYSLFTGGGFLNMSGFEVNSLIGSHFGMLLAGYRYQVAQSGFLPGYVGTTLEYGNAAEDRKDIFAEGLFNGSVYLSYSTPLGPLYVGVGWSEERSALYFLSLGNIFGADRIGRR